MVERRFIEVHGMFFFSRVVRILEGPIYDSISVYLKTSVIHYQKKDMLQTNKKYYTNRNKSNCNREKDSQPTIIINKHRIFLNSKLLYQFAYSLKLYRASYQAKRANVETQQIFRMNRIFLTTMLKMRL
jgi:hypothetical protein